MQIRESLPSPISSRITILLFWYVVPLSTNQTSFAPGKEEIDILKKYFKKLLRINNVVEQVEHLQLLKNFYLSTGLLWVSVIWADQSEPYTNIVLCRHMCMLACKEVFTQRWWICRLVLSQIHLVLQFYCSWTVHMHYSPILSEYTPMYMVWKIPKISGIWQW